MPAATTFTLTLTANYHRVPVKLAYVEDAGWAANTITVTGQYQVYGQWFEMPDFVVDDAGTAAYFSSIFGLQEGWTVACRVRFLRTLNADGSILEDLTTTGSVTTRISPVPADSTIKYLAPLGNDTTGDGSYATPYRTLAKAASVLGAGGTIILKNGIYGPAAANGSFNWDASADGDLTTFQGTSGAYKCIRAETPGGVIISGKRLVSIAQGSWTRVEANIYSADFSAYMDTANNRASVWMIKESDGTKLYWYRNITTGSGDYPGLQNGLREGFTINWATDTIYVRTATDVAPAANTYSTGWDQGLAWDFTNVDFTIVEGITFEMFGSATATGGDDYEMTPYTSPTRGGLRLTLCDDLVIRNCTFHYAVLSDGSSAGQGHTRITVEDCDFAGHNWWGQMITGSTIVDNDTWDDIKNSVNEDFTIHFGAGVGNGVTQLVIRRCTITGSDNGINIYNPVGNNLMDLYENTFTNMFDGAIESNGAAGILQNCAFWHNTFTNIYWCIRLTSITNGPVWIIGNYGTNAGSNNVIYASAFQNGAAADAHMLIYHNTLLANDVALSPLEGSSLNLGFGAARLQVINNIFQHPAHYFGDSNGDLTSYSQPNYLTNNCWYSVNASAGWGYDGTIYSTEAAYITAAGSDVTLSGNRYFNPYPDGITGDLDPRLKRTATRIKGISVIAADANGNRLGEPGHLGYFPNFKHFLAPGSVQDQSVIEAPESVLGSQWRPHWRQSQLA